MRKKDDSSNGKRSLYARRLKRQITIRLYEDTLAYLKGLAEEAEIPYQTLINLVFPASALLRVCGSNNRCCGRFLFQ